MEEPFDFVVIGAGTAGLTAARFAAQLGVRVALVEKHRIGGDCTWTGCVPSKALLQVAKTAHAVRTAGQFGITAQLPQVDMVQVRAYLQQAIADIYQHEDAQALASEGIEVVMGEARFLTPHTIQVGERTLAAEKFLLATGARPAVPAIPGMEAVPFVTHEQLFDNEKLPPRLLVLGAGPVGVEMAQAYGRLGSKVTIVDEELLSPAEPQAREVLKEVFAEEGIRFVAGQATAVFRRNHDIILHVKEQEVAAEMLLVAAGRHPNVSGLDLEKAGIQYSDEGIKVNTFAGTSASHIYAVGDCVEGAPRFTHFAGWQASQATRNALLPGRGPAFSPVVPWTIFTDPAVAHVGLAESEARQMHGDKVAITRRDMEHIDRAVAENARRGFIKMVHRKGGKLLGATVVAPHAGELITEFALAMQHDLKVGDLANTIHVYPTYGTGVQRTTAGIATANFLDSLTGKLVTRFFL